MRTRTTLQIIAWGVLAFVGTAHPQSVFAQGNSLFKSSGLTTGGTGGISGTLGGTGFSSATGGRSGLGSSTSGLSAGSGFGSSMGGMGGAGGNRGGIGGASGGLGTGFGATGLNAGGASGFVGRTGTTMAGNAQAGQAGGNARSGMRSASRNSGFNNNQSSNQSDFGSGSSLKKSSSIRPRQRVAFEFNSKSPAAVAGVVSTRIDRIALKNPTLKQVAVQVVGDQIVLSGKVKTRDQSKLAENLLRLEPGVKSIRNELEVEQTTVTE